MRSLRTVSISPKVAREGNSNPLPSGMGSRQAQYAEMLAEHLSLCNPKPEEIKENTEDAE